MHGRLFYWYSTPVPIYNPDVLRTHSRPTGFPQAEHGFTLLELLIVIAVISVLAALAVPGLLHARIASNEASAIASLRAIGSAQSTFASSCADGAYAMTLDVLGSAPSGQSAFLSPDLGSSPSTTKSGYTFGMTGTAKAGTACTGATALAAAYHAWADPVASTTGRRFFATNTTHSVWEAASSLSAMSDTGLPSVGTPIQ